MKTLDFFNNVQPAYHGTWDQVEDCFKNTSLENKRLQELMADITLHECLEPVRLRRQDGEIIVSDGMHRSIAHKWLNRTEIPVEWEQDEPGLSQEEQWVLSVVLEITEPLPDEDWDHLHSLTSYRLDQDTWINCDVLSQANNLLTVYIAGSISDLRGKEVLVRDSLCSRIRDNMDIQFHHHNLLWEFLD